MFAKMLSKLNSCILLPLLLALTGVRYAQVQAMGLGGAKQIKLREMAEKGLLPDGTPIETPAGNKLSKIVSAVTTNSKEVIEPEFVTLPLDNFGSNDTTFQNRFWVAESGYKGAGHPIFLYDNGEGDAEPNALFRLQNKTSFFKQMVDHFGGIGIVWEHRYYGESVHVNITQDTPPEEFVYLTSQQALADVPVFAWNFSRPNFPEIDLTPDSTPWIFVGGSYPGMRAAFMRELYPETIFASYASSAPVEAKTDMSVYYEPIYRGMDSYGFGNCTKDIHAAIIYMDKAMEDTNTSAALKEQFLGRGAAKNSNAGFADALSTIFWSWQSYGVGGGLYGLQSFCDWIETDHSNGTNGTVAGSEGWAPIKGAEHIVKQWASYPAFLSIVNNMLDTTCRGPEMPEDSSAPQCNLELRQSDSSSISWTWQYCTQWGFLQSANLGPSQLVSRWNSLQHQKDICHRQFPTAESLLPDWPLDNQTNADLGGWTIRPSNTYWSGGEFDPWRTLSPLSSEPWAPHPILTQSIPACNVSTSESEIFGYIIPHAQHCYDFKTAFAGGKISREFFTDALTEWLKCFNFDDES